MPGALLTEELFVAGTGKLMIAETLDNGGPAAPANEDAAWPVGWDNLGYVTKDGVKMTVEIEEQDEDAWQSADPLRTLYLARRVVFDFVLRQFNAVTIPLMFGGGEVVDNGGATHKKYELPATMGPNPKAFGIEANDGDRVARIIVPRVDRNKGVDISFTRVKVTDLPMAFKALANDGVSPCYFLGDPEVLVEAA